jgi:hypothetical protein
VAAREATATEPAGAASSRLLLRLQLRLALCELLSQTFPRAFILLDVVLDHFAEDVHAEPRLWPCELRKPLLHLPVIGFEQSHCIPAPSGCGFARRMVAITTSPTRGYAILDAVRPRRMHLESGTRCQYAPTPAASDLTGAV